MMIFTSIYGVVDGFFVSNFVGKTSFAAVNFIMPFLMITGAMGFMFGTGGSALIAKIMGEGKKEKAQKIFSLLIMATIICGIVIGAISIIFLRPVAVFLGARGEMLEECIIYGRIILVALPFLMLQYAFSSLAVTAEKPKLGLIVTVTAGVINMVGDALFMAVFQWGIAGAAMASALGQIVGGIIPLIYFVRKNTSRLRIVRPEWDGRALLRICTNGCSELMSNISMSVVGMLYNTQLMKYAGEVKKTIPDTVEIIDGGMVTTKEQAMEAGDKFRAADVDLVFLQMLTYATSYNMLPAVRDLDVPVVLVNVQKLKALDYDHTDIASG